jgi:hypothetical protein
MAARTSIRWLNVLALALLAAAAYFMLRPDRGPDLDRASVVAQVQRLNELATVKYTVQRIVELEEPKSPVGLERILLILQARVRAGVDLSALRPDDVTVARDGAVTVRLPRAKLLDVAVDDAATRVWSREKTWWTPWVPYGKDLEQRARLKGLEAVRQGAIDSGILNEARRNAQESIRTLLSLAGAKSVVVTSAGES